jgi:polysaccharide export outer membrane protein
MKSFVFALVAVSGWATLGGLACAQTQAQVQLDATGNLPIQRIGADDLLAITVYDAPEFTRSVRVSPEGAIRMPMLRAPVKAAGLLPAELEIAIAAALKDAQLLADPYVTIAVSEYHSRPVSVIGAVRHPVVFQAAGEVTLLDALARAEGLSPEAGGEILLSHPSIDGQPGLIQRIPIKALIDSADPALNVRLTGGEDIRVPEAGRVFIVGDVKKPGSFTVRDEGDATVLKALAYAEGLAPNANRQAYIYRREASGSKVEIPIELKKMMQRKAPDVALQANDILYIPDATGIRVALSAIEKTLLASGAASAIILTTIH